MGAMDAKSDNYGNRIVGSENVGLASLGYWTGKQLLGGFFFSQFQDDSYSR